MAECLETSRSESGEREMYDDSTQWILDQISNHSILTKEEEQEAAKDRIEAFEALRDGMMAHPYSWDFFV